MVNCGDGGEVVVKEEEEEGRSGRRFNLVDFINFCG